MKAKFKLIATALLLATAVSCSKKDIDPTPPPKTPPVVIEVLPATQVQNDIDEIDGLVTAFITKYNIPGASVAISKDGKLVYRKGYGLADKEEKTLVKFDSQFRLTRITTTYTGVAIMKLVQEGKFKIDDNVFGEGALLGTKYGSKPYSDNYKKITVRQLLNMTSGGFIDDEMYDSVDNRRDLTNNDDFFHWMMDNTRVTTRPGVAHRNVFANYFVAGRIIEKFSGKQYIDYIKEDLLKPIGDVSTELGKSLKRQKYEKEVSYYAQGRNMGDEYTIPMARTDAGLGLVGTATNALRFINAIDGFPSRPDILNQSSLEILTTPSNANQFFALGIGGSKQSKTKYGGGSMPGSWSVFMRHDNGTSIVLLMNGNVDSSNADLFSSSNEELRESVLLAILENRQRIYQDIDQF